MAEAEATEPDDDGFDWHVYTAFEQMGFDPLEVMALMHGGVSPSEVREFCKKHQCDERTAVSILL